MQVKVYLSKSVGTYLVQIGSSWFEMNQSSMANFSIDMYLGDDETINYDDLERIASRDYWPYGLDVKIRRRQEQMLTAEQRADRLRGAVINWLSWNDPNGEWSSLRQNEVELSTPDALEAAAEMLRDIELEQLREHGQEPGNGQD